MFGLTTPLAGNEIRATSTTKKRQLGTRGMTADGRVFRYAKAGMALYKGIPVISRVYAIGAGATWNIATDTVGGSHVPTATFASIKFCTTGGMNDSFASLTELQDGYLYVAVGANAGDLIQIESNSTCGTDCGDITVYMKDDQRLTETISDTAVIFLVRNPYDDVRGLWSATDYVTAGIGTTTSTGLTIATPAGIPMGVPPVDVASGAYFWLQTWGLCVAYSDGGWTIGHPLYVTTTTATENVVSALTFGLGALSTTTSTEATNRLPPRETMPRTSWGHAVTPAAASNYGLAFLTISP